MWAGVEGCDDGNVIAADGCSSTCTIECTDGDTNLIWGGSCYFSFDQLTTWAAARAQCMAFGGYLARAHELRQRTERSAGWVAGSSWIGLNDQGQEGLYEWDLGAGGVSPLASGFTNWEAGEPSGDDCVRMVVYAQWEDRSCATPTRYVCERPLL